MVRSALALIFCLGLVRLSAGHFPCHWNENRDCDENGLEGEVLHRGLLLEDCDGNRLHEGPRLRHICYEPETILDVRNVPCNYTTIYVGILYISGCPRLYRIWRRKYPCYTYVQLRSLQDHLQFIDNHNNHINYHYNNYNKC